MQLTGAQKAEYERRLPVKGDHVPVITPLDPLDADPQTTSLRIGKGLLALVDKIADEAGLNRTGVVNQMLKWAVRVHQEERKAAKK